MKLLKYIKDHSGIRRSIFIIGAQKSGTSALHNFLASHPEIGQSQLSKETRFFASDKLRRRGSTWFRNTYAYAGQMAKYMIDSTPEYMYFPYVAQRIYKFDPDARIIAILRDPLERAFSAYNMFWQFHSQDKSRILKRLGKYNNKDARGLVTLMQKDQFPSFEKVVDLEFQIMEKDQNDLEPSFVRRGNYYQQLKVYYGRFPSTQIKVLSSSDLLINTSKSVDEIFTWLELEYDEGDLPKDKTTVGKRTYALDIRDKTKVRLQDYYAQANSRLKDLIGRDVLQNN